eukprot:10678643-Ditylum_brightwellii.AAC.1
MIAVQRPVLLKELYLITRIFCVKPPLQDPLRFMMHIKVLLKGFDPNTSLACQSSQKDLIRAIWTKLKNSPLDWKWQHVKGHQDDVKGHKEEFIEPLDCPSTLNVEMDNNATAHQRQDSLSLLRPCNTQLMEKGEGTPHQHKIFTNLEDTLVEVIGCGRLKQYWTSHHTYNSEAEEDIDWAAIATASEKKSFQWKYWSSKMASSFIPTGA